MATVAECQPGRLVVVGHRASLRAFVSEYLACRGHDVTQAATADEALAAVQRQRPHLVLLDLRGPAGCGVDALARMRREHPDVDVIVLTGSRDLTVARATATVGALDLDRLDRSVAAGLRRSRCSTFGRRDVSLEFGHTAHINWESTG